MKYHNFIKGFALLLAALMLLAAVVSGFGIGLLLSENLYEQDLDTAVRNQQQNVLSNLAEEQLFWYASTVLGNCPEHMVLSMHGNYQSYLSYRLGGTYYTISDKTGTVLFSDLPQSVTASVKKPDYSDTLSFQYMRAASEDELQKLNSAQSYEEYSEFNSWSYYNERSEKMEDFWYTYTPAELSISLYLVNPDFFLNEFTGLPWELVNFIYLYRTELIYVFAISTILFFACAVYLFCAAGRKPGQSEIKASGLNRIPLDLYACIAIGIGTLLSLLGVSMGERLLYYGQLSMLYPMIPVGYGISLLIVGFLYACVSQMKTPNDYWLRNSVIGRCCRLLIVLLKKLWVHVKKAATRLPRITEFCKVLLARCWQGLKKLYRWIISQLKRIWHWLGSAARKLCKIAAHYYGMLPLIWQWLLTGFLLLFLLFLCLMSYHPFWVLLGVAIFVCAILYGSNAFGSLLSAAKRMHQGDLDTKISDPLLIGAFHDFADELNALADVVTVAAEKQMRSERMKAELITNVSHDLKTPLTSIINYVDLLQKTANPEEQEKYLEVLSRQSQHMKKLIEDLMEMSKASTGNLPVDIIEVDGCEAVTQALGEFSDKLEKVNIQPVFNPPEEPMMMRADGRLCWRVLSNLLSNAVKYALPGTRLYVDIMEIGDSIHISMKNISAQPLNISSQELMERFVRGDASRNTEGSGLGLNIAQSLMILQHGKLDLTVDGDLFKAVLSFPKA